MNAKQVYKQALALYIIIELIMMSSSSINFFTINNFSLLLTFQKRK